MADFVINFKFIELALQFLLIQFFRCWSLNIKKNQKVIEELRKEGNIQELQKYLEQY